MMEQQQKMQLDSDIKKRKITLYTVAEILGIFALCIIGNAFDWLALKFDFSNITKWSYWSGVIQ
jgi:hypothetical protein